MATKISHTERGSGCALVLLHGFPLDASIWENQLTGLADAARVIAADLPGFGKTKSDEPFTMKSLAEDVHEFLEQIKAIPCVLGGLSMGGYVALEYAKKYPNDLRGLALIDTRAEGDTPQGKEGRDKMIELAKTKGSNAVAEQMLPKMLAEDTQKNRPAIVQRVTAIMQACPPLTIQHALAAMRDRADHTDDIPSIPVPTAIIVGDSDAITPPAIAEAMHKKIPRSSLHIVKGAGHLSPIEQPEQVNQALRGLMTHCDTK